MNFIAPFKVEVKTLHIAISDSSKLSLMRNLKTITKKDIELHAAKVTQISDYIQKLLKEGETTIEAIQKANKEKIQTFDYEVDENAEVLDEKPEEDIEALENESEVIKFSTAVVAEAIKMGVSDIHIEPREEGYKIRVRRDGVMQKFMQMTKRPGIQLVACLKNMANMDIAERRASQDGKILRKFEGNRLEFRCSTVPGKHGEKMVLRILNSDASALNLDTLIHIESVRNNFRKIMNATNGIVIVSGPTGSGKSTTLAAALREKDTGDTNIVTAEDPIEYDMGGDINQVQVNRAKGQTFAMILRTFLRQDPDVILIGETRDPETAESSMDAAETGHLVFGTLHTSGAPSTINRIIDVFPPEQQEQIRAQISTSLKMVVTQRLLKTKDGQGRCGAFEVMKCTAPIQNLIREAKIHQIPSIMQTAVKDGMITMTKSLEDLVKAGKIDASAGREN